MTQPTVDRSRVPLPEFPAEYTFPPVEQATVGGGIPLYHARDLRTELATIWILWDKGVEYEDVPGLLSFTAGMLTRGTAAKSAEQVSEAVDELGARLSFTAAWDMTSVQLHVLREKLPDALALLRECLTESSFGADEIERLRAVREAAIHHHLSDPEELARRAVLDVWYGSHPYGHRSGGTIESLRSIDADTCRRCHRRFFAERPRAIVASSGLDTDKLAALLTHALPGEWEPAMPWPVLLPASAPLSAAIGLVEKKDAQQTSFRFMMPTPFNSAPEAPAAEFLGIVLGGMFLSRLNSVIREVRGYTYGIGGATSVRTLSATYGVGSNFGNDVTEAAVRETLEVIRRFGSEPLEEGEFTTAKMFVLGTMLQRTETGRQVAGIVANAVLHNLPIRHLEDMYRAVRALDRESLLAVQQQWFTPSSFAIGMSGDLTLLHSFAHTLGEVTVCDVAP